MQNFWNRRGPAPRLAAFAAMLLAGAVGCEEVGEEAPAATNRPAETRPAEPAPSGGTTVGRPAGSTLGAAKRQADRTVDQVEQRQRDLEKQIENPDG